MAIASLHADEPRNWAQIAALYGELARLTATALPSLTTGEYRYLHSTRGELLRRLGRTAEARDAYQRALALVHDDAERRLLERRLVELGTATAPTPR